jgi:hypothetical protein
MEDSALSPNSGISLSRFVHDGRVFFEEEDYYNSLAIYLDQRRKQKPAIDVFKALVLQNRGITLLKVLARELEIVDSSLEGSVNGESKEIVTATGNSRVSKLFDFNYFKDNRSRLIDQRNLVDPQRLSRRIQIKLRSRLYLEARTTSFINDAIHKRLQIFLRKLIIAAHTRSMTLNTNISTSSSGNLKPKERIREMNTKIMQRASVRLEEDRRILLQLGEQSNKRKRDMNDELDEDLLLRAEKAREEDEERKLADAANEATRSALGDAKYLKWFAQKHQVTGSKKTTIPLKAERIESLKQENEEIKELSKALNPQGYRVNISSFDVLNVLKSERPLYSLWPRVIDRISAVTFLNST